MTHLDGNMAAGPLGDVFAREVTTAIATCAACGNAGPLGEAMVYGETMGTIVRCVACEQVLLRFAETPRGIRLDMRGIGVLAWDVCPGLTPRASGVSPRAPDSLTRRVPAGRMSAGGA